MERFTHFPGWSLAGQFDRLMATPATATARRRLLTRSARYRKRSPASRRGRPSRRQPVYVFNHHERELEERLTTCSRPPRSGPWPPARSPGPETCRIGGSARSDQAVRRFADTLVAERDVRHGKLNRVALGPKTVTSTTLPGRPVRPPSPAESPLGATGEAIGEQAWIEVIQKMDEVYNDLLQYRSRPRGKNAALEESHSSSRRPGIHVGHPHRMQPQRRHRRGQFLPAAFFRQSSAELEHTPIFDLFADDAEASKARQLFTRVGRDGIPRRRALPALRRRRHHGTRLDQTAPRLSPPANSWAWSSRAGQWANCAAPTKPCARPTMTSSAPRASSCTPKDGLPGPPGGRVAHELNNPISFVSATSCRCSATPGGSSATSTPCTPVPPPPPPNLQTLRQELRIDRVLHDMPPSSPA